MSNGRRNRNRRSAHTAYSMKCGGIKMPEIEETPKQQDFEDPFLAGNWRIEKAVKRFLKEQTDANHVAVLCAIKQCIQTNAHLLSPVIIDESGENFEFRLIQTDDGKLWQVGFTSQEEFDKGAPSECLSNFMDVTFDACMETDSAGMILNPWGDMPFTLPMDLIRTLKICMILEHSNMWIPCKAANNESSGLIPDILQNGEELYFPAFSTPEEMGEYGNGFEKIEKAFPEIIQLAKNNEQHPVGIVIDAFTSPFLLRRELYKLVIDFSKGR